MECEFCKQVFSDSISEEIHLKNFHKDRMSYKCMDGCDFVSKNEEDVHEHHKTCEIFKNAEFVIKSYGKYISLVNTLISEYVVNIFKDKKMPDMEKLNNIMACVIGTEDPQLSDLYKSYAVKLQKRIERRNKI